MNQNELIQDMSKKLKPILGNRIDDLYFKYSVAEDYEEKNELMQFISTLYRKHLGRILDEKVLLEPPKNYSVKVLETKKSYEFYLKIHTKESSQTLNRIRRDGGKAWRKELIEPLVKDSKKILDKFQNDPKIGIIGSKKWFRNASEILNNEPQLKNICKIVGIKYNRNLVEFIGGTMFWIRGEILEKSFTPEIIDNIYSNMEAGYVTDSVKGTYTHAMERFYGVLAKAKNYKVIGI